MESPFINIGSDVKAIEAAKTAVLEILNTRADQRTLQIALKIFRDSVQPKNTMITNCNFMGDSIKQEEE